MRLNDSGAGHLRIACLILALVTLLIYLPVCFHDFILLDDPDYVTQNPIVQAGLTWTGVKWAFTNWTATSNWHPVTWLSHMLDCQLFGLNPGAQHLVNVLFHAANAVLLLLIWFRLTQAFWVSAFVAALFAWHPLHVESVAWIAERKDVLSTFLGLLSLWFYIRYVRGRAGLEASSRSSPSDAARRSCFRNRDYVLALCFFGLGLMSKAMLVTLPFVFLLLDYWPLERVTGANRALSGRQGRSSAKAKPGTSTGSSRTSSWSRLALEKWPFFVLTVAFCVITVQTQREKALAPLANYPVGARLNEAVVAYADYLFKTFWPTHLSIIYPLNRHLPPVHVGAAALILGALSILAWRSRRKRPYLWVGWLWFLGTLVPVIGLVQVGPQALADRYTYVPLIGVFIACAHGAGDGIARMRLRTETVSITAGLVLLALVLTTEHQLRYWQNTKVLFTHALAVTKSNPLAHFVLGLELDREGQREKALVQMREGLRAGDSTFVLTPRLVGNHVNSHLLLAQAFQQEHRWNEALAEYRTALRLDPDHAETHNNLGNLLDEMGKPREALAQYRAAVRLKPDAPLAHDNLGTTLIELGHFHEGMQEYAAAERLQPDDSRPHYLMGKAWLRQGRTANAIREFRVAVRLNSNDVQSLTYLARVLAADENPQFRNGHEAVTLAERANQLTGGRQPFVLGTLAMAYAESGRFQEAQQALSRAIAIASAAKLKDMVSGLQDQLKLYRAGRAYREAFTNIDHL